MAKDDQTTDSVYGNTSHQSKGTDINFSYFDSSFDD